MRTISADRMGQMIEMVNRAISRIGALPVGLKWDSDLTASQGELGLVQKWLLQAACTDVTVEHKDAA